MIYKTGDGFICFSQTFEYRRQFNDIPHDTTRLPTIFLPMELQILDVYKVFKSLHGTFNNVSVLSCDIQIILIYKPGLKRPQWGGGGGLKGMDPSNASSSIAMCVLVVVEGANIADSIRTVFYCH